MLGAIPPLARTLLIESVRDVLRIYGRACRPSATPSTKERQA